jgi:putative sporulation protein YyaC
MLHHIHYLDKKSVSYLSEALIKHYLNQQACTEIVVVCIGTTRYSGDSLGPMVGSRLEQQFEGCPQLQVYGTLNKPVHALNLQKTLAHIAATHSRAYIIAVDAALGQFYKVGTLQLVEQSLQPGVSLDKELPPIGNIHIKGIVNNLGLQHNHKVLEHTSLTFVEEMGNVIARILTKAAQELAPRLISAEIVDNQGPNQKSTGTSLV